MGREQRLTLVLVNLAGIMEQADESLLPAVYKEVGAALHATPTGLGSLTLFRSVVQSACYPLAAFAAARYNRCHVIAAGAFLWAAATFLVAISSSFVEVAISRGFNGVGLALVVPAIQSLVADSTDDNSRGSAFGWLQLTSGLGSILGSFSSLLLASTSFMGIDGWRVAFHLVGIVSVLVGVLILLYAEDPHFPNYGSSKISHCSSSRTHEAREFAKEARQVLGIPSFQIIVAQGVIGSFAGSALSFSFMWLELVGFSHEGTGFLTVVFVVATCVGGLFGGKMGDFLSGRLPNTGRILLSQISSASAVPLSAVLMLALPDDPSPGFAHGIVMFIMGLTTSWIGPATINPIFAEIVPERSRTSIYALDSSLESILASFAPAIVGMLAEHVFGYKPVPQDSGGVAIVKTTTDRENAASLAKAVFTVTAIPMLLCCAIYSFLYCTYPRDRERARMDSLMESEMQQMESESLSLGDDSRARLSECCDGRSAVIDVDYREDDEDEEATLPLHALIHSFPYFQVEEN